MTDADDQHPSFFNVDAYLSEALTALEIARNFEHDIGTIGEHAQRLDLLRRCIQSATELRNEIELLLAEAMPESRMVADGLRITRERANRSYWKDAEAGRRMRADIEHALATHLSTDVATGEVNPERRNVISHAIHELWEVLPAPSTMKAGSRKYGLSIREYREFQDGFTIRITPVEDAPDV